MCSYFQGKNNGHYYCVICSQPTDSFFVTVVCGKKEDSNIWSDIRNMKFHTLNKTPSVLIITMCISTMFQKLIIGTMATLCLGNVILRQLDINS